ncbi:MAG TPA: thioredoxin-disulfide reductase [Archaeoglobaceae archaeon]|nr:thioredoxin-disulfide reductase [Archaeoglobaceae archaeon]
MNYEYDVLVIGAGPAGSTAALNCVRSGLKTAFFESTATPSSLSIAPGIENYPGFEGKGYELLDLMRTQATKAGAEYKMEPVIKIEKGEKLKVISEYGEYQAKAVIIATGGKHKELGVPGEKEFIGKGVSYCAVCDGNFFRGKKVLMIGGGYGAVNESIYLKDVGCEVTLVTRKESPSADSALLKKFYERNIPVISKSKVVRIEGSKRVERVVLQNLESKEENTVETDGVFIAIGKKPQTEIFAEIGLEMDSGGYIVVDKYQATNVEGIFAAGDCCDNPLKQIVTACGDGAVAANSAYRYIRLKKG